METKYKTDFLSNYPDLLMQWHPSKNRDLSPDKITRGSSQRIVWKCEIGPDHEWVTTVKDRIQYKTGCPYCSNKKVSVTNSLAIRFPEIAAEWDHTKNSEGPEKIVFGSCDKVHWKCPHGPDHEWETSVVDRTRQGRGCPCCAGKKVSVTNSLQSRYPHTAAEWDPDLNGGKTPEDVTYGSKFRAYWMCLENRSHESWPTTVNNRTASNCGCPRCKGTLVTPETSLATLEPELSKEWHPSKNKTLKPKDFSTGSGEKVWWKCLVGRDHEWQAAVKGRARGDRNGCPFCLNRKVSVTNSLASKSPEIACQWDRERNGKRTPDDVAYTSHDYAYWRCDKSPDHRWKASIRTRTVHGNGCGFCAGQFPSVTNSLMSLYPEVAKELHPTLNEVSDANQIVAKSGQPVYWQCKRNSDHVWPQTPHNRVRGSSCPECVLAPRSKEEMRVALELHYFVPFDLESHKVHSKVRLLDVDMLLDAHKIAVEYDGSRFHEGKEESDSRKSGLLRSLGWTVIRLREFPLAILHQDDICFPRGGVKRAAELLVEKVLGVTGETHPDFPSYQCSDVFINVDAADRYIEDFLERKSNKKS
jgi:hypothetical protein